MVLTLIWRSKWIFFAAGHRPERAIFSFAAPTLRPAFSPQQAPRAPVRWKPGPTWSDAAACFDWNWTSKWSDISSEWCVLATKRRLRRRQRLDETLMALLHDRKCAGSSGEHRALNNLIWRYRRKRNRTLMNEAMDATLSGAPKPAVPKISVVNWRRTCGPADPKTKLEERFTEIHALTPEDQTRETGEKLFWVQRWLAVCDDPINVPEAHGIHPGTDV